MRGSAPCLGGGDPQQILEGVSIRPNDGRWRPTEKARSALGDLHGPALRLTASLAQF